MLETIGYALIGVIVAILLFYLVVAFLPSELNVRSERDRVPFELPPADERLAPADVDHLRIPTALRGYRFAETDDLISRLTFELEEAEAQLARRESELRVREAEIEALRTGRRGLGVPEDRSSDERERGLGPSDERLTDGHPAGGRVPDEPDGS